MPDRRTRTRFEIVGRLPATLTAERSVRILNVSRTGALVESSVPMPRDSVFNITLESERHLVTMAARVCHVRAAHVGAGYFLGLEFVANEGADLDRLLGLDSSADAASA